MAEHKSSGPLVAVVMGSTSDWETMRHAVELLDDLGVPNEHKIVSAHRTPEMMAEFWLPVLGVPVQSHALHGMDSLLSIAQMPAGIPVGTLAIGTPGATNAALLAASILATTDEKVRKKVEAFRKRQTDAVLTQRVP